MKVLSSKTVYKSKYFKIEQRVIERNGKTYTKDFLVRNEVVLIIPYTATNELYMESQFRDALQGLSFEVVAGTIEAGDDPLETAKRELSEEAGLTAKTWNKIAFWDLSANMEAKIHVYAATDLEEGKQHLDDDEEIKILKLPLEKVLEKIYNGEMTTASQIATLFLFKKLREEGKL